MNPLNLEGWISVGWILFPPPIFSLAQRISSDLCQQKSWCSSEGTHWRPGSVTGGKFLKNPLFLLSFPSPGQLKAFSADCSGDTAHSGPAGDKTELLECCRRLKKILLKLVRIMNILDLFHLSSWRKWRNH